MNTHIERLDNHTARLTVEVDAERLEQAKRSVARKLANRLNIPGFRKGKAPYKIIVNYVGEGALLEDAVEEMGNEVYREVIADAGIEPYGPAQIEDFKADVVPTLTYVIPLAPEVDLKDYRAVRREFVEPEITDDDVNRAMRALQEQHAVVEESQRPVAMGNRITAFVDARLANEGDSLGTPDADVVPEAAAEESEGDEHDGHEHHVDERTILHEHDAVISLEEDALAPGFAEALVGAGVGERREFDLTYPDNEDEYGELAGKRAHFDVQLKKIENVTLPALNDDFAARVSGEEDAEKTLSLLELRMKIREDLEKQAADQHRQVYGRDALQAIIDQAEIRFPEAMVVEQTQRFLEQMDDDLRRRGLTLEDYKRIYRKTDDDLLREYREPAIRAIKQALVMRDLARTEGLTVSEQRMTDAIDRTAARFGDMADRYRELFQDPGMRQNMAASLLTEVTMERVVDIARGQAPELGAPAEAAEDAGEPAPETVSTATAGEDASEPAATQADEATTDDEGATAQS